MSALFLRPISQNRKSRFDKNLVVYGRVAKYRGARERGSHEVTTRRTNCDPGCKKYYRRENICSETNIQNVQHENIYRCVTYILIISQAL